VQEILNQYGPTIGFGLLCVMLLRQYVDLGSIFAGVRSAAARLTPAASQNNVTPAVDNLDTREHQAVMLLAARAERRKSPECRQAVSAYLTHWLDDNSRTED